MEAKCKLCQVSKDMSKMKRKAFPIKNLQGEVIYRANKYWYFCNDVCASGYQEF